MTFVNSEFTVTENYAMNNDYINKLHRGADNVLDVFIKNKDLKKVPLQSANVKARFIDTESNEVVLEKYLCLDLTNQSQGKLFVYEGDLKDIEPGLYNLVFLVEEPVGSNSPDVYSATTMYSDHNGKARIRVEVIGDLGTTPSPTYESNPMLWTPSNTVEFVGANKVVYSSAIPANKIRNHKNSLHTFSIIAEEFTGKLEVLGSLDIDPPSDQLQYFTVPLGPDTNEIEFTDYTGTEAWTIQHNLFWVKFKLTIDSENLGEMSKLSFRS